MTKPASDVWINESNVVGDPEVGYMTRHNDRTTDIPVLRLTSNPHIISTQIYPEHPASFPDASRFVFRRSSPYSGGVQYWVADLRTLKIRQITDEPDANPPMVVADGSSIIYTAGRRIMRMDPVTFERELIWELPASTAPVHGMTTISHDGTRLAGDLRPKDGDPGVVSIDLKARTITPVFAHRDCLNAHRQYSRNAQNRIVIQVNDGIERSPAGELLQLVGPTGASLWVVNDDGTECERLAIGCSTTEHVQGHQCWQGKLDRVITAMHRRSSEAEPWVQDCIMSIGPGDTEPRIVGEGEGFTHIHCTADGKYWVADCNRTARIYVGSCETGKYKLLAESDATFGAAQTTHPHPCFIGDRYVGWQSDKTGSTHVYVARIPDGFLEALA